MEQINSKKLKLSSKVLPLLLAIMTVIMGIGYANVNNILMDISGDMEAIIPDEVFITDVRPEEGAVVNGYDSTILNSKVILDENDINDTASFEVTLYNNTKSMQCFDQVLYELGEITYDNENIDFELDDRFYEGYELGSKESVTFTLTFKYSDEYKMQVATSPPEELDNRLNSIINFSFGHLIIFESGYGDSKPDNYYLAAGSDLKEIETDIPEREGYIFMGWYDNESYEEGQMFYDENQDSQDISNLILDSYETVLYEGWAPVKYTINYHYGHNYVSNNLPFEYQEVEYIESYGQEYIDTGVEFSKDIMIYDYELSFTDITKGGYDISGVSNGGFWGIYDGKWMSGGTATIPINLNQKYSVVFDGSNSSVYVDGELADKRTLAVTAKGTFLLFSARTTGSTVNNTYFQKVQRGVLEIKKSDKTIRYMVPCVRKTDSVVGMYDLIEHKFYENIGSGEFTAGPIVHNIVKKYATSEGIKFLNNSLVIEDKTFAGWYDYTTDKIYSENEYISQIISDDTDVYDLYAIWDKNLRLNFVNYESSNYVSKDSISARNIKTYYPDILYKDNLRFAGWYKSDKEIFDSNGNYSYEQDIFGDEITLIPKYYANSLPENYQQLEYIESTGSEYIDTEVEFARDLEIFDYFVSFKDYKSNGYDIAGVSNGGYWGINNGNWSAGGPATVPATLNEFYSLKFDASTITIYTNGVMTDRRTSAVTAKGTMLLFGARTTGSTVNNTYFQKVQRGILEIKKAGQTIRLMIPCKQIDTEKIGMYDIVNSKFYFNLGSGGFIPGPLIE